MMENRWFGNESPYMEMSHWPSAPSQSSLMMWKEWYLPLLGGDEKTRGEIG